MSRVAYRTLVLDVGQAARLPGQASRLPYGRSRHGYLASALILVAAAAGCQQKMALQPSLRPLQASTFFEDGRAARPLVEGTVPRGHLHDDIHLHIGRLGKAATGAKTAALVGALGSARSAPAMVLAVGVHNLAGEPYAAEFPFAVTDAVMKHGRERYGIFCALCHDHTGSGNGTIVRRGFARPPSFHIDRLRQVPAGYIVHVITTGYGAMPDHKAQVPPHDRWAIAAYVRALQFSQHAPVDALPPEERPLLIKKGTRR
jgi:mono/diheme cytochrome c family protein